MKNQKDALVSCFTKGFLSSALLAKKYIHRRRVFPILSVIGICLALAVPALATDKLPHHDLSVSLDTRNRTADIRDTITLHPDDHYGEKLTFLLHANYKIKSVGVLEGEIGAIAISEDADTTSDTPVRRVDILKPFRKNSNQRIKLSFEYSGAVYDPMRSPPEEPPSENEGILLSGASFFYPQLQTGNASPGLMTFKLNVSTLPYVKVISQGDRFSDDVNGEKRETVWISNDPMEEIFLIADRFQEYAQKQGELTLYAFLLEKDDALAARYLNAAKPYIDFYQKLLGPYPYRKFALVENSRQTGYGMPSFTLMGSQIIRFPFILDTSYPHEILHNWWGNGVYIDPHSGNWSEGLTAYLSDHLLAELKGKGEAYRFQELMKYLSYVNEANDFPLSEFEGRDSMVSQAVGYGKTLMTLHMLRTELGNKIFLQGLRHFYKNHRFGFAGFSDIKNSFESVSGRKLTDFFRQWTEQKGAPEIELSSAAHFRLGSEYDLQLEVRQKQSGPAFIFNLPVAVWLKGSDSPKLGNLLVTDKQQTFKLTFSGEPMAVLLDPYTSIFRRLNSNEVPPSIGQTFGSEKATRILPGKDEFPDLLLGYHQMAQAQGAAPVVGDDSFAPLPEGSIWVYGRNNQFAKKLLAPQLEWYGVKLEDSGVTVEGKFFPWADHSFTFTINRPGAKTGSVTWVIAGNPEAVPGLIRKLPHYGKYGYLVFRGDAPDNQLKGVWPLQRVGIFHAFAKNNYPLPPQPPLVDFKP